MDTETYTLEELAEAVGMTVRNVRSYQTRGLIAAPKRSGRRSVYGPEHLARLQAIHRARDRGASLALIEEHLGAGGSLDADSLTRRWLPPTQRGAAAAYSNPRSGRERGTDLDVVLKRVGAQQTPAVMAHVDDLVAAGVLRRDGMRLITARDLAAAVVALERHGMPVEQSLRVALGAAQAGQTLAATLAEALATVGADARRREAAHADLVALAVAVLTRVVAAPVTVRSGAAVAVEPTHAANAG